jgi:hypothetical protein
MQTVLPRQLRLPSIVQGQYCEGPCSILGSMVLYMCCTPPVLVSLQMCQPLSTKPEVPCWILGSMVLLMYCPFSTGILQMCWPQVLSLKYPWKSVSLREATVFSCCPADGAKTRCGDGAVQETGFAMMEAILVLAALLQRWTLRPAMQPLRPAPVKLLLSRQAR